MATVFETVRSAADELRAAGVDTPQHDAKLLLAEAFRTDLQHVDKAMLMGDGVERLAEKEDAEPAMERFQTMLARRLRPPGPRGRVVTRGSRCSTSPAMRRFATLI